MYELLTEFMGITLTDEQIFFFGSIFLIIMIMLVFSLLDTVIKLFR